MQKRDERTDARTESPNHGLWPQAGDNNGEKNLSMVNVYV